MTDITLYHNPRCSKSRQTLQILEDNGHSPEIVLYLENPPSVEVLEAITKMLGVGAHDIIRTGEDEYDAKIADLSEAEQLAVIEATPKLMQRPIVVANDQARIGRPPESVLEIL